MKLTVVGGGGVRAPLFVASTLRRSDVIGLDEICLLDVDENKLRIMGSICRHIVATGGQRVRTGGTVSRTRTSAATSGLAATRDAFLTKRSPYNTECWGRKPPVPAVSLWLCAVSRLS